MHLSAHATASGSEGIIGSPQRYESLLNSVNSSLGLSSSACARVSLAARAVAFARVCPPVHHPLRRLLLLHMRTPQLCTMHVTIRVRTRVVSAHGPRRSKRVKVGVSGPAEDLPPVLEVRWHSDNESLFGPQNKPKLMVSVSLGHSVVFQVRRASSDVPSSITLDHGDLLVMDGPAQPEYAHRTVSGLQGPRVNLTYRWVTRHATSCPLAGVVCCVLPSCVHGLAEPNSRWLGERENKWPSSWGLVLLLLILVSVLLIGTLINIRRGHRNSGQRPSCSVVCLSSRGRARDEASSIFLSLCLRCSHSEIRRFQWVGDGRKLMDLFGASFCQFLYLSSWLTLGFTIGRKHRHSCRRPVHPAVHPSRGRALWVGRRRWRLSRRCQSSKRR